MHMNNSSLCGAYPAISHIALGQVYFELLTTTDYRTIRFFYLALAKRANTLFAFKSGYCRVN